jgi:prophage antirepressor-like protein
MEIIKAFNSNNLHTEIVIKGTISEPLFRASDIGEILEMGNIRTSIQQFDETERHVHTMDTSTGPKQVTFLTEKGLYIRYYLNQENRLLKNFKIGYAK